MQTNVGFSAVLVDRNNSRLFQNCLMQLLVLKTEKLSLLLAVLPSLLLVDRGVEISGDLISALPDEFKLSLLDAV